MNKSKKWLVVPVILIIFGFVYLNNSKILTQTNQDNKAETTSVGCSRTTRLENSPQYDRALSLLQQRLTEYNSNDFYKSDNWKFNFYTPELINCIQIIEQKQSTMEGAEGYFVFNGEDIKTNYFPIIVSNQYQSSDDIATAITLTHELTHVQQYIDYANGKKELDCVNGEVEAMMSQRYLYLGLLNSMEQQIVDLRMKNPGFLSKFWPEMDNPYKSVALIMKLYGESKKCDNYSGEFDIVKCRNEYLRTELKDVIKNDDFYKKQCGL